MSEAFKDEPPDNSHSHYFDEDSFDMDAFATSSLQAAASAILAVQEQRLPADLSTSMPGRPGADSPSLLSKQQQQLTTTSSSASLSRSSSVGKPSLPLGASAMHPERHMWTQEETKALVDGCNKHGIGNWKAILNDEEFAPGFHGRTPGDLKDRFRTYFPDAYHELYPNAKTHTSRAVRSKAPDGKSIFEKGKTKERRPFTAAEDEVLRKGYEQFGSHWAVIAKDAVFEGRRKSTDLRDRFRNAFPSLYEQAGYKPRAKAPKKERRQSSSGSMSQHERAAVVQGEWRGEVDGFQRPVLQARSETSTSVHSQAVSEHSEHSDDDSDALDRSHAKERSESSYLSSTSAANTQPSSMARSNSHSSSRSEQHSPQGEGVKCISVHGTQKPPSQALRRTQSTKRANCAKLGSLDHAVKSAFSKSSKEAALASHQHHHHLQQHLHMQPLQSTQQQPQRVPMQELSAASQRPPFNQSLSTGWAPRLAWLPGSGPNGANLANMDLDQMDEIMNSHSATELLGGTDEVSGQDEAMSIDEQSNGPESQADFAHLYQHLALTTSGSPASRALSIESFQDLLDPVLPLSNNGAVGGWDQATATMATSTLPWIPVSSATAALDSSSSVHAATSATRREHEHNQWAGDLLHRGSYTEQQHGFVSMASMHLTDGALSQSRSADDNLGQQRPSVPDHSTLEARPSAVTLRSGEQSYTTPSVHELISRSTRRQSYPPRPVGLGEEFNGEDMMQAAYGSPYPYPADDISLLNSSAGGSLTLFPSLVNSQASEYGHNGLMRRRRSTDTLREGAFSFPQPWKGGMMDSARHVEEEDEMTKEEGQGRPASASVSSRHGTSDHSRSLSDAPTNDDDEDAPSRAASVGNIDLVGSRDSALYAESLPDLSTGMGGPTSSVASDSAFSHQHHLQISYDDMDLPSFLNRSPSWAPAATVSSIRQGLEGGARRAAASQRENDTLRQGSSEAAKATSKSVDLTNLAGTNSHSSANGLFSFASNPMNDAGALDRLEHLYLEGLHTPSSPLANVTSVTTAGYGGPGNGAGSATQRFGALNAASPWWSSTVMERGGPDASGYESV